MSQGSSGAATSWVLLGGGFACLLAFSLLTVGVTQGRLAHADGRARAAVLQSHHPALGPLMAGASWLGGHPGQTTVVVLGAAMLWRRRRRWAVGLPVLMLGAAALQLSAKWAIDRDRPNLDPWGYPSAHTLTLVVLLGYVAYVVGTSGLRSRWRSLGAGGCAAAVCVVAYSRMYLDMHWLSDVLGGISGGLAFLLLAIWTIGWMPAARRAADLAGHRPFVETAAEILVPAPADIAPAPAIE
jgi:membrane-associated phospholipid phosphatase